MGWQHTTIRSEGNIPRIKRLMNDVSCNVSTAKLGTMLNQTRTHKVQKLIWRSIFPSICKDCSVAVGRLSIFLRWLRWFHSRVFSEFLTILRSAPVLRRLRTMYMIFKTTLWYILHFQVGFAQTLSFVVLAVEKRFSWKHIAEGEVRCHGDGFATFATLRIRMWSGLWLTYVLMQVGLHWPLSFSWGSLCVCRRECGSEICLTLVSACDSAILTVLPEVGYSSPISNSLV